MNINYSMNESLYRKMLAEIQSVYSIKSSSLLNVRLYSLVSVIAVIGVSVIGLNLSYDMKEEPMLIAGVLMCIGAFPLSWFLNRRFKNDYYEAMIEEYRRSYNKNFTLSLDEVGVLFEGNGIKVNIPWGEVSNIYNTNNFLLFVSNVSTIPVPRSELINSASLEIDDLLESIEKLSNKKIYRVGLDF